MIMGAAGLAGRHYACGSVVMFACVVLPVQRAGLICLPAR